MVEKCIPLLDGTGRLTWQTGLVGIWTIASRIVFEACSTVQEW